MAKVTVDEYIDGAVQVLARAVSAVHALDGAVGMERAERLRDIGWALFNASALLRRAADIEEQAHQD